MVNNGYTFEKVRRIILTPHNVHNILKAKIPQCLVPEPDVSLSIAINVTTSTTTDSQIRTQ